MLIDAINHPSHCTCLCLRKSSPICTFCSLWKRMRPFSLGCEKRTNFRGRRDSTIPIGQGRGPMTAGKVFQIEKTFYMDNKQQSWSYIKSTTLNGHYRTVNNNRANGMTLNTWKPCVWCIWYHLFRSSHYQKPVLPNSGTTNFLWWTLNLRFDSKIHWVVVRDEHSISWLSSPPFIWLALHGPIEKHCNKIQRHEHSKENGWRWEC